MAAPDARHHAYDLRRASGLRSSKVFRVLDDMLDLGWLTDGWEEPTEVPSGRLPRRFYEVTPLGRRVMAEMLEILEGNAVEDLENAAWYIQREIARREQRDAP